MKFRIWHGRPHWRSWRFWLVGTFAAVMITPLLALLAFLAAAAYLGPVPLDRAQETSVIVLDRQDRLLRAFTTRAGRWRLPVTPDQVDPRFIKMLLAYEDKRFYRHFGIDPLAQLRALWQLLRHRRVISGGSTLTMQVARLLEPRENRSLRAKLRQMVRAIQLERRFSKSEILQLYLRLAPYGGNIEGVRAASLAYFGREPKRLTIAQAALLVALPQSPEYRRPDRRHKAALKARNRVLTRLAGYGVLNAQDIAGAIREPVPHARLPFPKIAPHLAEAEIRRHRQKTVHRLTIDRDLQARLEKLASIQALRFSKKHSLAILVADHQSGEVLAYIGAANYLDHKSHGPIDMVQAIRSPGSALKPFVYALGFEAGLGHPETLIEDRPVRFGAYRPKNFDERFHGTVTMRQALQLSLNIPAVKLLHGIGPARLVRRLERAGVQIQLPRGAAPTLPVVLGGLGISLFDLTQLYTALARNGDPVALNWRRTLPERHLPRFPDNAGAGLYASFTAKAQEVKMIQKAPSPNQRPVMFTPEATWYVRDILRGTPPPPNASARKIAYKTGTSYGYRDAWSIGFDGQHVIGVWVGRPDGAASPAMTGYTAAAPILFDAFQRLGKDESPLLPRPRQALVAANHELPPPLRRFTPPGEAINDAAVEKLKIVFPLDGAQVALATGETTTPFEPLALKARGGTWPLTWLINGKPLPASRRRDTVFWTPDGEGFTEIGVIDATGQYASVQIRID